MDFIGKVKDSEIVQNFAEKHNFSLGGNDDNQTRKKEDPVAVPIVPTEDPMKKNLPIIIVAGVVLVIFMMKKK